MKVMKAFALSILIALISISYLKESSKNFIEYKLRSVVKSYKKAEDTNTPQLIYTGEKNNYGFKFDITFVPIESKGYPNLFQTDDGNEGLRIETSGNSIGFVIKDTAQPNGLFGRAFDSKMAFGVTHQIHLEYDPKTNLLVIDYDGKNISNEHVAAIKSKNFLVGTGFNNDRVFNGKVKNVEGEIYILDSDEAEIVYYVIYIFLLISLALFLLRIKKIK